MHGDRLELSVQLPVDPLTLPMDPQGRQHRRPGVLARIRIPEDDHEAVAGRLVDVAAMLHDLVQEGAEVALHEPVHLLQLHLGAEPGVAGDVREQHRDVGLALVEDRSLRGLLDQVLDGLGDELGQVGLDGLEDLDAAEARRELLRVAHHLFVGVRVLDRHGGLTRHGREEVDVFPRVELPGLLLAEGQHALDLVPIDERNRERGPHRGEARQTAFARLHVAWILLQVVPGEQRSLLADQGQEGIVVADGRLGDRGRHLVHPIADDERAALAPLGREHDQGRPVDEHLLPDGADHVLDDLVQVQHGGERVAHGADRFLVVELPPEEDAVHGALDLAVHRVEEEDDRQGEDDRADPPPALAERRQDELVHHGLRREVGHADQGGHDAVADGALDIDVDVEEVVAGDGVGDGRGEDEDRNGQDVGLERHTEEGPAHHGRVAGERRDGKGQGGADEQHLRALPGQRRGVPEPGVQGGREEEEGARHGVEPGRPLEQDVGAAAVEDLVGDRDREGERVRRQQHPRVVAGEAALFREDQGQVDERRRQQGVREQVEAHEAPVGGEDVERDDGVDPEEEAGDQEREARLGVRLEDEGDDADEDEGQPGEERDAEDGRPVGPVEAHRGYRDLDLGAAPGDQVVDRVAGRGGGDDRVQRAHRGDRAAVRRDDPVRVLDARVGPGPVVLAHGGDDHARVDQEPGEGPVEPAEGVHEDDGARGRHDQDQPEEGEPRRELRAGEPGEREDPAHGRLKPRATGGARPPGGREGDGLSVARHAPRRVMPSSGAGGSARLPRPGG